MRVGFTGAQGTGKTTLLRAVEKSDLGFTIVPSTARTAADAGFLVNRDADPMSQLVTTVGRVATEDRLFRQTGHTISDRTPLDSLAYTLYQGANVWGNLPEVNEYYMDISVSLVLEHMYKYDYIIYFPPLWAPKADGLRDTDIEYQRQIDALIRSLLEMHDIPFWTVPRGNTSERLNWLRRTILVD